MLFRSGLEVEALDNAPGVYSARYAGEEKDPKQNMKKLIAELSGKDNRKARFRTVIALILNGETELFEGIVEGRITEHESGNEGFGYDPIFVPEDYTVAFAEISSADKNKISRRGRAVEKLINHLQTKNC